MDYIIKDLLDVDSAQLSRYYAEFTDKNFRFYEKKFGLFKKLNLLMGKVAIDSNDGKIIASYLFIDQMLLANPNLKSAQSIDTLVRPDARGGNILRALAKSLYSDLKYQGYQCIYGMPSKSLALFLERVLKWNKSKDTFRYIVFIPLPVLRLIGFIANHFLTLNYKLTNCTGGISLKHFGSLSNIFLNSDSKAFIFLKSPYIASVLKSSKIYVDIGFIRKQGSAQSWLNRLFHLSFLALHTKGMFYRTYASVDSETARYISCFFFATKSLPFSGKLYLKGEEHVSFGEQSIEFIEYDNFFFQ
jgi:hypothetical protein